MPKLVVIFNASIREGYYLVAWKKAITLVIRKLNKANYTSLKVYRLIALLNLMGKVFKLIIARRISRLAEEHHLLLDL